MPTRKEKKEESIAEQLDATFRDLVLIHVVSHPTRYSIAKAVEENPLYINQLCRRLGLGRRIITFHLMDLEKFKLVETYLDFPTSVKAKKKAVLARFTKLTQKGRDVLNGIDQIRNQLSGSPPRSLRMTSNASKTPEHI